MMQYWRYRRRFTVDGMAAEVVVGAGMTALTSSLRLNGVEVASDRTPVTGPEATRNHHLAADLRDGRRLEVEAGYINWWNVGVAARVDGRPVHESHPGKRIAFPAALSEMTVAATDPTAHWKRNWPSLAVDVALGLLFFATAKLFGLTTAALVGAAAGAALIVMQRFVKVDLVGGLALFGVATLLLSAGYALVFQDEDAVKLRTTVIGLIVAAMFVTDGLAGGRWLGRGLGRYLPYEDIDFGRLSLGIGALGATLALLNVLVVRTVSTDVWLLYTTFGDVALAMGLFFLVLKFARPRAKAVEARSDAPSGA
jgi:intracellular septation protein A